MLNQITLFSNIDSNQTSNYHQIIRHHLFELNEELFFTNYLSFLIITVFDTSHQEMH